MNRFKDVQSKLAKEKSLIYFDCETSPSKFWAWGTGKQYITEKQIVEGTETKIMLVQWMFEGDSKVSYLTWDKNHNDKELLRKFSEIMQGVKVAVSQNGKEFDHKVLRYRLMINNLSPLKDVLIFDTLLLSQGSFRSLVIS